MSDDKLAFLDEPEAEAPQAPEPVAQVEPAKPEVEAEAEPSTDGRPRDPETGRFVPISALLDERDKRQATTRELEETRKLLQQYQQPQEQQLPDDPRELVQMAVADVYRQSFDQKLNTSELLARTSHGDQTVTEAQQAYLQAMQSNPQLAEALHRELHPYDYVVKWHKQNKLINEIGADPEAWRKAEAEKIRQQVLAELQGQGVSPAQSSQQPPPSVVGRPAAAKAGTVPVGPGNAFEQLFKG